MSEEPTGRPGDPERLGGWPSRPAAGETPVGGWPASAFEEPVRLTPTPNAILSTGAVIAIVGVLVVVVLIIVSLKLFTSSDGGKVHQLKVFEDPAAQSQVDPGDVPSGYTRARSADGVLSISVPKDWTVVELTPHGLDAAVRALPRSELILRPTLENIAERPINLGPKIVAFASEPEATSGFRPNVIVRSGETEGKSLEDLVPFVMEDRIARGWVQQGIQADQANGGDAYRVMSDVPGRAFTADRTLIFVAGETVYRIDLEGVVDDDTVDKILHSVKVG